MTVILIVDTHAPGPESSYSVKQFARSRSIGNAISNAGGTGG